ncbi:MAG TPA: phage major capsid protein [Anaerolineae bacterium]|nr:phage major capsid protein [Anaerolineae bacterium]
MGNEIDPRVQKILEEAHAVNQKGIELYTAIVAGDRGIEDMPQADAWLDEAKKKADGAHRFEGGLELNAYLNDGEGSLTAGTVEVLTPGKIKGGNGHGAGDGDRYWRDSGHFGMAVLAAGDLDLERKLRSQGLVNEEDIAHLYERQKETKTLMQEGLGASGGFLVEVPYLAELFMKAWEGSIVRRRARVIPMGTRQIQMPTIDQTITPANQKSAFFGGVNYQWIEEGESKPELELKFKLVTLTVHELAGYLPVTNNLIEDSAISINGILNTMLPASMADAEDWWFINGNGAGVPQGIISAPCTIQVARAGATAIAWADIKAMVHAFQPGANGVWIAHICCKEEIMELQDAAGNALWLANIVSGMPERLMGYPIIWTEKTPNLGTKGDIGLYDLSYYLLGDRRGPTLEMSKEYLFRYNQTAFRISERVDGQPWLSADVDLRPTGAVSISPFVTLNTYGA